MSAASSAFDDFGDPDRSPRAGRLARVAHWAVPWLVATFAVRVVTWFVDVTAWLTLPVAMLNLVALIVMVTHQGLARICVRCMESVPADAPVRAQRRRWALWLEHRMRSRRWGLGLLALVMVIPPLGRWALGIEWREGDPGGNWLYAPGDVAVAVYLYALVLHHRVSPWCPYCRRWDEGGEHEVVPTPDPTATRARR